MAKTTKDTATDDTEPAEESAAATDTASVEAVQDVSPYPAVPAQTSDCVVDDVTPHMGRAVNGKVCSAHAMRYRADGSPRTPQESMATMHPRRMR